MRDKQQDAEKGMLLRPLDFVPASGSAALNIRAVLDSATLDHFAHVIAANWPPPDQNTNRFFQWTYNAALCNDTSIRLFVGYWNGEPVATCQIFVADRVAGIYNVATCDGYRNRGIATVMVSFGVQEAIQAGCRLVSLQASAGTEGIYARLGFRACGRFKTFQEESANRPTD